MRERGFLAKLSHRCGGGAKGTLRVAQRRLRIPVRVQLRSILHWVVTWTAGRISHAGTVPATCSGRIEAAERARAERIASIIVDLPDGCGYEDGTIRQVLEPSSNAAGTYAGSHLTPRGRNRHVTPCPLQSHTPSAVPSQQEAEAHKEPLSVDKARDVSGSYLI